MLKNLHITNNVELIFSNIGDVVLSNDIFDFVQRVDKPQSAMIALNWFFGFELSDGFV